MKKGRKLAAGLAAGAGLFLLAVCGNHLIQCRREAPLLTPLGRLVQVEGRSFSVYTGGSGEQTLVFLSGGGTCSPILDFRSLYSRLEGDHRVAVVEKLGYGFSDDASSPRDLDTILSRSREALRQAGCAPPYVLCPHSMSGLEALYWAQQYPEEVAAIVGLDMAVPPHYEEMSISLPLLRLGQWAARLGLLRLIPGAADGDAVRYGTLTREERQIYRALFYRRTASEPMLREAAAVRENARLVAEGGVPRVPMLLFLSDGTGGTGFDAQTWRRMPRDYLAGADCRFVELDCPHYVHDHEYETISREIEVFLSGLAGSDGSKGGAP